MAKKLIIAVDCDDVLIPSSEFIIEKYNKTYGTNVKLEEAHSSKYPGWGGASREEIAERIYNIQVSHEYTAVPPRKDAIAACSRLSERHQLHLVTARPGRIMPITIGMLEKYFPGMFDEIEHVGLDGNKGTVCQRLKADILVDDNLKHLETARECGVPGLIWFGNYPWQKGDEASDGVVRCVDWVSAEREIERIASGRL